MDSCLEGWIKQMTWMQARTEHRKQRQHMGQMWLMNGLRLEKHQKDQYVQSNMALSSTIIFHRFLNKQKFIICLSTFHQNYNVTHIHSFNCQLASLKCFKR